MDAVAKVFSDVVRLRRDSAIKLSSDATITMPIRLSISRWISIGLTDHDYLTVAQFYPVLVSTIVTKSATKGMKPVRT